MHGHKSDFILCPMLCITLDRQTKNQRTTMATEIHNSLTAHSMSNLSLVILD